MRFTFENTGGYSAAEVAELITLHNDFHRTAVNLRLAPGQALSDGQKHRARRALCGIAGCTCGNELGMRGPNPLLVRDRDGIRRPRVDEDEERLVSSGWTL